MIFFFIIITTGIIFLMLKLLFHFNTKFSFFCATACIPLIWININSITSVLTIDESKYIKSILDLSLLSESGNNALLYQYRIMQMIIGTFVLPLKCLDFLTLYNKIILFKLFHWLLCVLLIFFIVYIIYKYLINAAIISSIKRSACIFLIIIHSIMLLPINMLLMKVCNYDSFSTYLSVCAVVILIAALRNQKIAFAYAATALSFLACLEKMSATPYFYACAIVNVYIVLAEYNKNSISKKNIFIKYRLALYTTIIIIIACLLISQINLEYIRIVLAKGHLADKISFKYIVNPLVSIFIPLFENTFRQGTENGIIYMLISFLLIFGGGRYPGYISYKI